MDLQSSNQSPLSPIPPHSPLSNNVHTLSTRSDIFQYLHRSAFRPIVSTWTANITSGFFTIRPGLTSALVRKHLLKSLATAKGHLRQDHQNVRSTRTTSPTTPISALPVLTTLPLPSQEPSVRTKMAYLQTVELSGKVSIDQTGLFPSPLLAVSSTSWSCTNTTVTPSWRNHSPLAANANLSKPLASYTPTFPTAASPPSTKFSTMNAPAA